MKSVLKLLALILTMSHFASGQRAKFILPETGEEISLAFHPSLENTREFSSMQIELDGKRFRLPAKYVVKRIPATAEERQTSGFWIDIPGLKLDPSRYFLVGRFGSDSDKHTLLFFISGGGASDAGGLLVVGFSNANEPFKVLEEEFLDVTAFQSEADGTALIIGKSTLSQVVGGDGGNGSKSPYATTYDPFSVFTLNAGDKAVYSLAASKNYNLKHYVWAGPRSRDDYAVFYNLPRHRHLFGAPASKMDGIFGGNK